MSKASANSQMTAMLKTWRMVDAPAETPAPASAPADAPVSVQLAEVLDLKAAAPLAAELLMLRGRAVFLDASQVQRVGGLCLQVLLSACRTWREEGIPLSIVNPSARFTEGIVLLGASTALPLQA